MNSVQTDSELENEITTLCSVIAAHEYRLLNLLAEFDRRRAWAGVGTRSCTHYWDEDGSLVIKACLPPEQGVLVLKALEAAEVSLKTDEQYDPWQGVTDQQKTESTSASAADSCVNDVPAGTPPKQKAKESCERKTARKADAFALIARDWLNPLAVNHEPSHLPFVARLPGVIMAARGLAAVLPDTLTATTYSTGQMVEKPHWKT